jgi:hypothetical protein
MKRKMLLRLMLIACFGVVAFGFYLWWSIPSHGINRASTFRIRIGMNQDEIVAIIGERPNGFGRILLGGDPSHRFLYWDGNGGSIKVRFDNQGRAIQRDFTPSSETILDKALGWLRLN